MAENSSATLINLIKRRRQRDEFALGLIHARRVARGGGCEFAARRRTDTQRLFLSAMSPAMSCWSSLRQNCQVPPRRIH